MPQLRSGVRRGRRPAAAPRPDPNPKPKKIKTPALRRTRRTAGRQTEGSEGTIRDKDSKDKATVNVVVLDDDDNESGERVVGKVKKTTSLEGEEIKKVEKVKEEVKRKMDPYDNSGGRGSDKGLGAEDEGSTAPIPERVSSIFVSSFVLLIFDIYTLVKSF